MFDPHHRSRQGFGSLLSQVPRPIKIAVAFVSVLTLWMWRSNGGLQLPSAGLDTIMSTDAHITSFEALSSSRLVQALNSSAEAFVSEKGAVLNPIRSQDLPPRGRVFLHRMHVVTLKQGFWRGDHRHPHADEVIQLVTGRCRFVFSGMVDGVIVREEFDVGPEPVGVLIPKGVCHALYNVYKPSPYKLATQATTELEHTDNNLVVFAAYDVSPPSKSETEVKRDCYLMSPPPDDDAQSEQGIQSQEPARKSLQRTNPKARMPASTPRPTPAKRSRNVPKPAEKPQKNQQPERKAEGRRSRPKSKTS